MLSLSNLIYVNLKIYVTNLILWIRELGPISSISKSSNVNVNFSFLNIRASYRTEIWIVSSLNRFLILLNAFLMRGMSFAFKVPNLSLAYHTS